jgi:hypothetical protein
LLAILLLNLHGPLFKYTYWSAAAVALMCDVCISASNVNKLPVAVHSNCERTTHPENSDWQRRNRTGCGCGVTAGSSNHNNRGGLVCRFAILLCLLSAIQFVYVKRSILVQSHASAVDRNGKRNGNAATARVPNRKQDVKAMKKTNAEMKDLFRENQTIGLEDLADIAIVDVPPTTWDEALIDRRPILDVLHRFGLNVTLPVLQRLPTWSQVVRLYGDQPVVWEPNEIDVAGKGSTTSSSSCAAFRQRVAVQHRYVGVAGQMNTGTNALSKYLTQNIYLAGQLDTKTRGVLWTVPWYKHGWADLRFRFRYRETPQDHSNVLAVVLIRDPFFWMQRYESCVVLHFGKLSCWLIREH